MTDQESEAFVARCNENAIKKNDLAIINHLEEYVEEYKQYSDEKLDRIEKRLYRKNKWKDFLQECTFDNATKKSKLRTALSIAALAGGAAAAITGLVYVLANGEVNYWLAGGGGVFMGLGLSELVETNTAEKKYNKRLDKIADTNAKIAAINEVHNRRGDHQFEIDYLNR